MINIPYQVREGLKKTLVVILVLVAVVAAVGIFWFAYLHR